MLGLLTVRETLQCAANFKLPGNFWSSKRKALVCIDNLFSKAKICFYKLCTNKKKERKKKTEIGFYLIVYTYSHTYLTKNKTLISNQIIFIH